MSTPVSIFDGPFTTNTLASKKFLIFYFVIIWGSILPLLLELYLFWKIIEYNIFFSIVLFPIQIYIGYQILVLSSILLAKIFLSIINLIHKPEEGVFKRKKKDRNYYFWSLRAVIKKWPIWISKFIPLPFIHKLIFRWFDNDAGFIEYGKNVSIGKGTSIKASMIFGDYLIIKKVKIGENVIIGSNSFISPGTQIGKNSIIGTMSVTKYNQKLKPNSIYLGFPVEKYKTEINTIPSIQKLKETIFNNNIFNQSIKYKNKSQKLRFQEKKFVKNLKFDLFIFGIIYFLSNLIPVLGVIYFSIELFIPYFLQIPNFFSLFTNIPSLVIFLTSPLIIIVLSLTNLISLIVLTKIFYNIIQSLNPVKEGIFHWENKNKEYKYYFRRSFLLRYFKWKLHKSLFPWLVNFAFNILGNCRIGKNTVIEDSYLAKEDLELGNNVYLGKLLLTNHLWDKNLTVKGIVIRDNVVISDNCCISPGAEIEQNVSILPLSVIAKYEKLTSNSVYYNAPLMKISNTELIHSFNLDIHDLILKNNQINGCLK